MSMYIALDPRGIDFAYPASLKDAVPLMLLDPIIGQ